MQRRLFLLACPSIALAGCAAEPETPTQALTLSPEMLAERQTQMRRYDTQDTTKLLSASAQLLQDLGFTIGETNAATGLLVATKDRSAIEAQQIAGQVALALVAALGGVAINPTYERNQKIRVEVVSRLSQNGQNTTVRATFQRVIFDNHGTISRELTITEPALYQDFFSKLSQSVFLTGNAI